MKSLYPLAKKALAKKKTKKAPFKEMKRKHRESPGELYEETGRRERGSLKKKVGSVFKKHLG